jgi:hypothetical protein
LLESQNLVEKLELWLGGQSHDKGFG